MSRDTLFFEELRIRRMPGFEKEGFTLPGLSSGINLIHGPNGSGKSTSARAMARLLWPSQSQGERVSLSGRFRLAGAEWSVDVDGIRVVHQRDGGETGAPVLPAAEDHQRYRLSLHDLLFERDESFARAILRESAGGYDVRATGAVLEPRDVPTRRTPATDELLRARADYERAVAAQGELRESELHLRELRERKSAAERALARVATLEAALEHALARENEAHARGELERFPEGMGGVVGDEYKRLCQIRDRLRGIAEESARAEEARRSAAGEIEAAAVPEVARGEEVILGLEQDLDTLREAERTTESARRQLQDASARLESERVQIGGSVDEARLAELDGPAMGTLSQFATRAAAVRAQTAALEAELRLLGDAAPSEDERRLSYGIRHLQCWLREPSPERARSAPARSAGVAAAVILVALGIALGVLLHPLYVGFAAVGVALLWPMLRSAAAPAESGRETHQREYGKLGLEPPGAWEPEPVERLLDQLENRAARARAGAERDRRRHETEEHLRAHAAAEAEIELERGEIAGRLGVDPGMDATVLAWLADRVSRWQAAYGDRNGAEAALTAAQEHADGLSGELRRRLAALGFSTAATTGELAAAIQEFRKRRLKHEFAVQALANAEIELRRLDQERSEREEEMRSLFASLGLDPDADRTVREWCERHKEYVRVREAYREAAGVARAAFARLTARGGEDALAEWSVLELQTAIAAERERAAERDAVADEISSTEARIADAKRSHGIEEALERIERTEEALRQARERDARGVIARELIAYLEQATRDQHLPAVFRRAREIFARITHGRYELRLRQEGVEPEFSAFDNLDRRGRALDELSSGTRVQLLIAVRVAFVEQQEHGVMLPLILDEVLGNSDDERARAIMEAALELAREGRQIFYFTAQADEVTRWRALAGGGAAGVELREIDLQQLRGLERALEIPAIVPAVRRQPPAPDGADHAEYGRRLRVPRLERASGDAASVHLWYLVEEPNALHGLLALGPERWGALQALVRDGGRPLVDERSFAELEVCGRATEAFFEAARVGVGLPVDRGVLEDSGAVTATFLDRVDDLARSLGGDGERLMEALEEGQVSWFGRASKDGLRAHLEEFGYLPQEAPLELGEIRHRVLARVATEIAAGEMAVERIDRLVGRLWVGVGGGDDPS